MPETIHGAPATASETGAGDEHDPSLQLLDDGGLMAQFIQEQRASRRLTPVDELQVPLFYTQGRETGWLYRLEWDE